MITPNTNSTFIQVKSDSPRTFTWKNVRVAEVIEMTTQRTAEKTGALFDMKREGKVCERIEGLNDLFLSAVDETLKYVFKEAGAKVVYSLIENQFHLKREEIVEKPEDFCAGLERLLGSAAPVIEKLILENLYFKLRLEYEKKDGYGFSDYLKELRKKFGC